MRRLFISMLFIAVFCFFIEQATAGERTMQDIISIIASKRQQAAQLPLTPQFPRSTRSEPLTIKKHATVAITLIFSDTCPHCKNFAPILMAFADAKHIPVTAYSLTGRTLPSIPQFKQATPDIVHHFYQNNAVYTPAIYLVSTAHPMGRYIHLGTGEMTQKRLQWAWTQANQAKYVEQLQ